MNKDGHAALTPASADAALTMLALFWSIIKHETLLISRELMQASQSASLPPWSSYILCDKEKSPPCTPSPPFALQTIKQCTMQCVRLS